MQQHRRVRDVRLRGDGPQPRSPCRRANEARLIGRNTRSGLNSVTIFRTIRKNFAPSRASLIFDVPDARRRLDRLEADVVAGLDERQRRRRRRGEPVGQQVEELAQAATGAPRGSRTSGPGSSRPGQVARRARSARCCRAAGACVACVRVDRAPITRSYSPSRDTRRAASAGRCWPSPSMIRTYSPVACRMPVFTAAPLPLLYGWRTTRGAGRRRARRRARRSTRRRRRGSRARRRRRRAPATSGADGVAPR